jgi:uncharacterized protein (AIM24 family)
MECRIEGNLAQYVRLTFGEGDQCWASKGSLITFDPEVRWSLKVPGGVSGATRRMFSGESVALTLIEASRDGVQVILSSNLPGKVVTWNLDQGGVITTRGSFIGAFGSAVEINVMVAKRTGAALFGGAGLFLQKISGQGTAVVHGSGDFIDFELKPGESTLVSTGNLAAFSESVDYDIQKISGLRRMFLGGEGLFMTRLTGPGRVLLQSLKRSASKPASSS